MSACCTTPDEIQLAKIVEPIDGSCTTEKHDAEQLPISVTQTVGSLVAEISEGVVTWLASDTVTPAVVGLLKGKKGAAALGVQEPERAYPLISPSFLVAKSHTFGVPTSVEENTMAALTVTVLPEIETLDV